MVENCFEFESGDNMSAAELPASGWGILKNMTGTALKSRVVVTAIEDSEELAQERAAGLNDTERVYDGYSGRAPFAHIFFHVAPVRLVDVNHGAYEQIIPRPDADMAGLEYDQSKTAAAA
jgi:hypothetical protein